MYFNCLHSVTVFNQFWDWIDNHCPENMGSANCQACDSYSGTDLLSTRC